MIAAVLELEELHEELDVRQRTSPQLEVELRVFAGRDPLALDASLHSTDLAHVVVGERSAVDDVVDERAKPRAELLVTGDDARLRERLPSPR